jgi:hypothetical protein
LADIDFQRFIDFNDQLFKEKGEKLEIYNPLGNWPNSIDFVTNYGVLKLDFPVDLTSIEKILEFGERQAF